MLKIAYHPCYNHPLKNGHRFPMEKYDLLPQQLIHEGSCNSDNFFEPGLPSEEVLVAVHSPEYLERLRSLTLEPKAARKIGFPVSEALVKRELIIAQGTIQSCHYALEHGIAMNIAGGTHHAYPNRGEAFCLLNDQAIGAQYLLDHQETKVNRILIVDLDVHQGNGTAEIFKNNLSVYTFSMHGASNYPFKKEESDHDIALENGTNDEVYLDTLKETLPRLLEAHQPDFIFYLSGVDILETDKLGKLGCTIEGCMERDRFVLQTCKEHAIPVQISMGGGYSPDINLIVEAHANTFRLAQQLFF